MAGGPSREQKFVCAEGEVGVIVRKKKFFRNDAVTLHKRTNISARVVHKNIRFLRRSGECGKEGAGLFCEMVNEKKPGIVVRVFVLLAGIAESDNELDITWIELRVHIA